MCSCHSHSAEAPHTQWFSWYPQVQDHLHWKAGSDCISSNILQSGRYTKAFHWRWYAPGWKPTGNRALQAMLHSALLPSQQLPTCPGREWVLLLPHDGPTVEVQEQQLTGPTPELSPTQKHPLLSLIKEVAVILFLSTSDLRPHPLTENP